MHFNKFSFFFFFNPICTVLVLCRSHTHTCLASSVLLKRTGALRGMTINRQRRVHSHPCESGRENFSQAPQRSISPPYCDYTRLYMANISNIMGKIFRFYSSVIKKFKSSIIVPQLILKWVIS